MMKAVAGRFASGSGSTASVSIRCLTGTDQAHRVFEGDTASEHIWSADIGQVVRMQSLLRSIGRPAVSCRRRSLSSAFFSVYSARSGSNLLFETRAWRWPTLNPSPSPLSANSPRACSSIAHMSSSGSHPEYRLPPSAKPTHYDLTIRTNLENQTFDGFVDVQCVSDPI